MAINRGVAPPNYSTEVGQFRLLAGDTSYVALVPPEAGFGNYTRWSDDEITGFIAANPTNLNYAVAAAYFALAAQAALTGQSIKDADLAIDTRNRAADLTAIANYYVGKGDEETGGAEFFDVVPTGKRYDCWPELAERPVCW